ncbi:UDP-N-acetylmuramoylalanyl-D-glutamyl-2,6-diaminopimelate--D-alanyl-D-alanine ligase [Aquipluma nitroreducens]|uniref:UDP-N-acetylmuramoyl-tripeptide--D-alanyl-D-alanine ligase n=1 Tax=Aquipluma nitroreducens TaxID=2010828 RepID=A0A5K7SC93_9BACT|nr:UDP-N-acetylmuramoyl-tripeptide--D-alanyl-D-alanine ligase [Aquipluma nitroreducens]BBE19203.1 UDP-N-acetylmuramoylalanyl-D-glutamyl-2,6-diaminopimelate--D-alanyl-D-alanine ligase [Aquipluma nitroreducens]
MEIANLYAIFRNHPTVTTDSRNIPANSIFFALKGDNFNGNAFANEAILKGAAYAVIDEPESATNDKMILVEDVLLSLQQLAQYHRNQLGLPILAITGTNGKTTTKELIAAVLSKKFRVNSTKGNLNNHIGVPLTLLSMSTETEFGVVEMGANHPGEIKILCEIANPDFGLITNIGKAHLEGFGSFEGVIKTKSEMYDFIRNNGGKCFVNADNSLLTKQANHIEQISYGKSTDYFMAGELASTDNYLVVKALFQKGWLYLKSKLIGDYNFENLLAAACVGKYFEVDPLLIQEAIAEYSPSNNRSQLIQKAKNTIIMDAYNANPTSMMAALTNFAGIRHENKCIILGDMLELGTVSAEEHQKITDFIEEQKFSEVYLIGPQFKNTIDRTQKKKFYQVELLSNYLKTQPIENKLILIKGSRGIHLEKILELLP